MKHTRTFLNTRPLLLIEEGPGANLGNCYTSMSYKVTSRHPLTMDTLRTLREVGFLGYGQEFVAYQLDADGKRHSVTGPQSTPTAYDEVQCVDYEDTPFQILTSPSINPYSGMPDKPLKMPYFVYVCISRVDSSD